MLDGRWRSGVERGLTPVGERLRRLGVTPDQLTLFGLVSSAVTAVLIASGHLIWAVVGIAVSGLGDLLDGTVARKSGQVSQRGAFFDSVVDRLSDALLFGGVGWYLARDSAHLPMLAFAVAAASMLISYERAKAESLGLSARGGLMERAERFVLLGVACAFGALMVPVLWLMLALTTLTAVQRFVKVWKQADKPVRPASYRMARRPRVTGPAGTPKLRDWWETRRPRRERPHATHPTMRRGPRS